MRTKLELTEAEQAELEKENKEYEHKLKTIKNKWYTEDEIPLFLEKNSQRLRRKILERRRRQEQKQKHKIAKAEDRRTDAIEELLLTTKEILGVPEDKNKSFDERLLDAVYGRELAVFDDDLIVFHDAVTKMAEDLVKKYYFKD